MYPRTLWLAAGLLVASQAASAAVIFNSNESDDDAGSAAGSIDWFYGGPASTFNGTSNAVTLETLDPGVSWSQFVLHVATADETQRAASASFAGLSGQLTKAEHVAPAPGSEQPAGWNYTFTFSGIVGAGPQSLQLAGFEEGLSAGAVDLKAIASAIPEPGAALMLLAGLGALGFAARRRH